MADNLFGPWTELGNPCAGTGADTTFRSQSTFVLPVPGRKDSYVFMADRWNQWDLPDSRYVWLPLEFSAAGKPVLRWHDQWSLDNGAEVGTAMMQKKQADAVDLQSHSSTKL